MQEPDIARLYEEHGWHVYQRGLRILRDEEEAWDVCHDVFVRLAQSLPTIRDARRVTAWLYRVTTNLSIDRLRGRRYILRRNSQPTVRNGAALPDAAVASRELVLRVLGHFSSQEQQLAILRYVDGLTLEEIEEVSGLTRKTVSKKLKRFKSKAIKIIRRRRLLPQEG